MTTHKHVRDITIDSQFIGTVVDVLENEGYFVAKLERITGDKDEQVVTIPLLVVPHAERLLVMPGAVFEFLVGRENVKNGGGAAMLSLQFDKEPIIDAIIESAQTQAN